MMKSNDDNSGSAVIASIAPATFIVMWLSVLDVNPEILGMIWATLLFAISGLFVLAEHLFTRQ